MGVPYAEVIGDPVAHSKSPAIHRFWLDALGLEGDYRATRIRREGLEDYFQSRRADPDWRGCNVTMPYKQAVEPLLDRLDPSAERAGSVNCVYRDGAELWGCNTDTSGVAAAIGDCAVSGNPVAVIGTGAAARAALWVLAAEEPGDLRIVGRDPAKGRALLEALRVPGRCFALSEAGEGLAGTTAIINATPLGMADFRPMPEPVLEAVRSSRADASVIDMVYEPLETELLAAARLYGRRGVDGLVMLIEQARDSFGHFFSADARDCLAEDGELRERLTR